MQDLVNLCVNNGLGVLSFVVLVIFVYKYMEKYNGTLEKFNETMILQNKTSEEQTRALEKMQDSIVALTSRIDSLEHNKEKEV